jgi:alkaline phosphatase D
MFKRAPLLLFAIFAVAADDPKTVRSRILFGSCVHQEKAQPVWDAILDAKPDLFIMAGDNIYGDTKDMDVLRGKYKKLASQPGYQKLLKMCPVEATWDDHDFGGNDVGASYPLRVESQQIFLDFFGFAKDDPIRTQKGIHHASIYGPPDKSVQVILLDTRYHRSPMRKKAKSIPGEGPYEPTFDKTTTILGEEQWKWLGGELRKPAKLRLIVSSIQVAAQDHGYEKWANFPHERERLFKLLQETRAEGVVILSGDRHLAELSVMDPGISYPLFDLTSSGLNQGAKKWRFPEVNQHRISGMFHGNNFGAVLVDWSAPDPVVRLQIRDEAGEATIQEKITLGLLKPGLMKSKGGAATSPATAKIDGQPLDAEQVKNLLNKEVTLEMKVASTGASKGAAMVYLNSSADFRGTTNMTIVLNKTVQDQLKAKGIDNPRSHFDGKNIRVVGPLTLFQERPQIIVAEANKISVAE